MDNLDPDGMREAAELGAKYRAQRVDLDAAVPLDIYALFSEVTGRDYDSESHHDELTVLEYAHAFETAARAES